jgi:hypothetical protein
MRQVVLLAFVACCGCTAVLGLDERERAAGETGTADVDVMDSSIEDSGTVDSSEQDAPVDSTLPQDTATDTSLPPDTFVPPDTAPPPDTFVPPDTTPPPDTSVPMDTAPADTSTGPCPFFGLSCAGGKECIVTETIGASSTTYSVACADPPASSPGGACSAYRCPEGYGCRTGYPSGTKCVPLCTSSAMCTAPYMNCATVTWTGSMSTAVSLCDTCNPVANTGCAGATRCGVGTPDTPPTCRPYSDFGGRNAGASCPSSDLCEAGNVCACTTSFGIDSCPSGGTCVHLCNTNADCDGKLPSTTTCKALKTGSPYKGCLP